MGLLIIRVSSMHFEIKDGQYGEVVLVYPRRWTLLAEGVAYNAECSCVVSMGIAFVQNLIKDKIEEYLQTRPNKIPCNSTGIATLNNTLTTLLREREYEKGMNLDDELLRKISVCKSIHEESAFHAFRCSVLGVVG